jgi:uncharacterized protein
LQKPNEQAGAAPDESLNAAQVLDFLRAHPDFLGKYAEVLAPLLNPERASGDHIVDLQRFIVERLKVRTRELEDERDQMVGLARLNLKSQARIHRAVLALLGAQSFEHLIQAATIDLPVFLGLDMASLCMETTGAAPAHQKSAGVRVLDGGAVDRLLGPARDMVLRPSVRGDSALFGSGATLVRSDALLRLKIGPSAPPGLLALASRKDGRFHPGQGTELLSFLARSIELSIRAWLDLPL